MSTIDSEKLLQSIPEISKNEFDTLCALIHARSGIYLTYQKEPLLRSRLLKRLRALNLAGYGQYCRYLEETTEEVENLINEISTNVTEFFRESAHFDLLKQTILPGWPRLRPMRVFSAGCATGEEPYSIAMCALEAFGSDAATAVQIVAGDISSRALERARAATYPISSIKMLPPDRLHRSFLRGTGSAEGLVRVAPEIQEMVRFQRLNLIDALNLGGFFDIIFCRNVTIYFDPETQSAVFGRLQSMLSPGGYLFIGHSESMLSHGRMMNFVQPSVYRNGTAWPATTSGNVLNGGGYERR